MTRRADERLEEHVRQKLVANGIRPPCRVTVTAHDGVVTLSGEVQYDYQRRAAMHALRALSDVKQVVDQLKVKGFQSAWSRRKEWEYIPGDEAKRGCSAV